MKECTSRRNLCFHRSMAVLLFEYLKVALPATVVYLWLGLAARNFWLPSGMLSSAYRLLCLAWLLVIVWKYFNDLYVFGRVRIIHFSGRLSFRFRRVSICYEDVREIRVQQGLLGRLLNFGTLKFSTAGGDEDEIIFADIQHPRDLSIYAQRIMLLKSGQEDGAQPLVDDHETAVNLH